MSISDLRSEYLEHEPVLDRPIVPLAEAKNKEEARQELEILKNGLELIRGDKEAVVRSKSDFAARLHYHTMCLDPLNRLKFNINNFLGSLRKMSGAEVGEMVKETEELLSDVNQEMEIIVGELENLEKH